MCPGWIGQGVQAPPTDTQILVSGQQVVPLQVQAGKHAVGRAGAHRECAENMCELRACFVDFGHRVLCQVCAHACRCRRNVHMYVCMNACARACTRACTGMRACEHAGVRAGVCINACMQACVCTCVRASAPGRRLPAVCNVCMHAWVLSRAGSIAKGARPPAHPPTCTHTGPPTNPRVRPPVKQRVQLCKRACRCLHTHARARSSTCCTDGPCRRAGQARRA